MLSENNSQGVCKSIASEDSSRSSKASIDLLVKKPEKPVVYRNLSSCTFSSNVDAKRFDIDGATSNTLSMVSTPWITESGYSILDLSGSRKMSRSSLVSWTNEFTSSSAAKTSTTIAMDWQTTIEGSCSRTTLPMFSLTPTRRGRRQRVSLESLPSTDSSWTFTSTSQLARLSNYKQFLKVKYPWSPATLCSGVDEYPSSLESLDTLASRKGSRVDVTTSITNEIFHPMNYITITPKFEESYVLDWTRAKEIRKPIGYNRGNMINTRV